MKTKTREQMEFCKTLSDRLFQNVDMYETKRAENNGRAYCGYNGLAEAGAGKYQLKAAIIHLRRELSTLSRLIESEEGRFGA